MFSDIFHESLGSIIFNTCYMLVICGAFIFTIFFLSIGDSMIQGKSLRFINNAGRGNFRKIGVSQSTLSSAVSYKCDDLHPISKIFQNMMNIQDIHKSVQSPFDCPHILACLQEMNSITLSDLALDKFDLDNIEQSMCVNIAVNTKFHITAFIIPKGKSLPLHDHPSMMVCSKVLTGRLKANTYTHLSEHQDEIVQVKVARSETFSPSSAPWFLTPSEENIHEFKALSTAVVFDILAPPYSEEDNRPCNFYAVEGKINENTRFLRKLTEQETTDIELPYVVPYYGVKP